MQIYWNRRNRLHKKRVQFPQDWLGTLTWPPFHWFGTSIWPPWRHVKTLYKVFRSEDCDLGAGTTRPSRPTAPLRCLMCVKDFFQFSAVAVQAILDSFSCRHEELSYAHICQLNIPDFSKIGVTMETYCLTIFIHETRQIHYFYGRIRPLTRQTKSSNHFLKWSAVVMRLWRYSSSL